MKHNEDGQNAEEAVADFLRGNGYKILERNWKTPQCEIDIVARRGGCVYFVEVKFRSNSDQGTGYEYVTPAKQKQMAFAANFWIAKHRWDGEYVLSAASVSGPDYTVEFIEEI